MGNLEALQARLQELAERDWDLTAISTRFEELCREGIPRKPRPRPGPTQRQELLDRVQRRAEEYCYLTRNCARGTATALFEEFGLGNIETIKALAAFPGIGMTGGTCGAVSGGLLALGLFFSDEDLTNYLDPSPHLAARNFAQRFQEAFGSLVCADIQKLILSKYHDPLSSLENLRAFNEDHARERCPLAPGLSARITAEIILDTTPQDT